MHIYGLRYVEFCKGDNTMIESIALLGRLTSEQDDEISRRIENCYKDNSKWEQKLAQITIDITNGIPVYKGITVVDLRPEHSRQILYRGGTGTGINPVPSAAKTDKDTLSIKILKFFENAIKKDILTVDEKEWLNNVYQCLKANEQTIRDVIEDIYNKNNKHSVYLTLVFVDGDNTLFVTDMPIFVKLFLHFTTPNNVTQGTCSICGKDSATVMAASSSQTYKFFNLDKWGFFWDLLKQYQPVAFPVCIDCLFDLEKGKEYIENNLNFKLAKGIYYSVIPQFFIDDKAAIQQFIDVINTDVSNAAFSEQLVLRNISKLGDSIAVNFLFLDTSSGNSAEKITMLVQDVYPSRLSRIYEAQDTVTRMYFDEKQGKNPKDMDIFAIARDFFPRQAKGIPVSNDKNKKGFDKYFLSVVQSIFEDKPLDNYFVFSNIMREITQTYHDMLAKKISNSAFDCTVKDAEMFISFLTELNLLRDRKEGIMENDEMFDEYFAKYKDLYNNPLKRGLFLLGAATRTFVDLQYNEHNSRPFLKELKSFKMNLSDFRGLVAKLQNKAIEYEYVDNKWPIKVINTILPSATNYLLQVDTTSMSLHEMNFYFVAGYQQSWAMSSYIGDKFRELKKNNTNTEEVVDNE